MLCGPNRWGSATRSESHFLWVPLLHAHQPIRLFFSLSSPTTPVSRWRTSFRVKNTNHHQQRKTETGSLSRGGRACAAAPPSPHLHPSPMPVRPLTIPPRRGFPGLFLLRKREACRRRVGGFFLGLSCRAMSCHSVSSCVLGQVGYCVLIKSLTQTPEPVRILFVYN